MSRDDFRKRAKAIGVETRYKKDGGRWAWRQRQDVLQDCERKLAEASGSHGGPSTDTHDRQAVSEMVELSAMNTDNAVPSPASDDRQALAEIAELSAMKPHHFRKPARGLGADTQCKKGGKRVYRPKEDVLEDCKRKLAEHRSAQSPLDPFLRERQSEPAPAPANASSERRSRAGSKAATKDKMECFEARSIEVVQREGGRQKAQGNR